MRNTEEFKPEVRPDDTGIQEAEAGGSKFKARLSSSVNPCVKKTPGQSACAEFRS